LLLLHSHHYLKEVLEKSWRKRITLVVLSWLHRHPPMLPYLQLHPSVYLSLHSLLQSHIISSLPCRPCFPSLLQKLTCLLQRYPPVLLCLNSLLQTHPTVLSCLHSRQNVHSSLPWHFAPSSGLPTFFCSQHFTASKVDLLLYPFIHVGSVHEEELPLFFH
jgi:hypothetical protein